MPLDPTKHADWEIAEDAEKTMASIYDIGDRLGPKRIGCRVGSGKSVESLCRHVDTCEVGAQEHYGERSDIEPHGCDRGTDGATDGADEKSELAPPSLHQRGDPRCGGHRTEHDHRNRERGKAWIVGQHGACETAHDEDHRHLCAENGLRRDEHHDIPLGDSVT